MYTLTGPKSGWSHVKWPMGVRVQGPAIRLISADYNWFLTAETEMPRHVTYPKELSSGVNIVCQDRGVAHSDNRHNFFERTWSVSVEILNLP
jgi:hypothetical protein